MPIRIETPLARPTAINAPAVSMEAAAAPARALAKVAGAIGQTADQFTALGQNLARIDNARKLSEERQRIAADYAKFQNDLANEIDPEKRLAATESFLSAQESALDQPGLPPDLRDSLTQHFSEFSTRARIGEAENSAKLTTRRAVMAVENEIQQARTPQEFEAAAANLPELGILPEQVERLRMDFDRNSQLANAELHIQDDPLTALQVLEADDFLTYNPQLDEDDRRQLIRMGKSKMEELRGEEIDILENRLAEGTLRPQDIEGATYLSPKDTRSFGNALKLSAAEAPISQQDYLNAWQVADTLRAARNDPKVSDDAYRLIHNEARTDILNRIPPSLQGDLKKELGYLSPAGRNTSQPANPSDRSELESIARAQIARAHDAGMYGDVSKEAPFESREKAARKAEDLRLQVKRFIAAGNRSPEEIRAYVDTLNGGAIDGDAPLIPAIPAPFTIGDEIDSLLAPLPGLSPGAGGSSDILLPPK